MKLKKILSSVIATAMAVTTFSAFSTTATAEGSALVVGTNEKTIDLSSYSGYYTEADAANFKGLEDWNGTIEVEELAGAKTLTVTFTSADRTASWGGSLDLSACDYYYELQVTDSNWVNATAQKDVTEFGEVSLTADISGMTNMYHVIMVNVYDRDTLDGDGKPSAVWNVNVIDPVVTATYDIELTPNEAYSQKTPIVDGKYSYRAVMLVSEDDIEGKNGASFNITNDGTNVVTVENTKCYKSVKACGETITAPEGYVFLAYAVSDIPEEYYNTFTCTYIGLY